MVKGNLDQRVGLPVARPCSEIIDCDRTACPAHDDRLHRCWLTAAPSLRDGAPPSCRACPVYREHKGDEIQDLAETFDVMALSLSTHIEDLRRAERVLSRQEQLLRTILDATPDLLCLLDEHLAYLAVNRAFAAFVGHEASDIVGRLDRDIFPPDEGPAAHAENRRVLASCQPSNREVFLQRNTGPMWLHIVRVPVTDREGRPMATLTRHHTAVPSGRTYRFSQPTVSWPPIRRARAARSVSRSSGWVMSSTARPTSSRAGRPTRRAKRSLTSI